MSERNNAVYKRGQAILNPRVQWNHEIVRFPRTASVESHRTGIRFTPAGEQPPAPPPPQYIAPPIKYYHHHDEHWWYIMEPFTPVARTGGISEENPEYVIPNELIAWHLYADPIITDEPTSGLPPAVEPFQASGSGLQQQRQGPQAGILKALRDYIWNSSHTFMPRVASLHAQYWELRKCIYYGAPKLKKVNLRSSIAPQNNYEWDVVQFVEDIENEFMSRLYNQFQLARSAIQSCEIVFKCLERICILVTLQIDSISPELKRHVNQLVQWVRVLDTRKRAPSGASIITARLYSLINNNHNLYVDWAPLSDQTVRIQRLIMDQIKFHDMCYGCLENLLILTDQLLDQWQVLLQKMLHIFELSGLPEVVPEA
jgi:hypothetical protein